MPRIPALVGAVLALLALLASVEAEHCTTWSTSETNVEQGMIVVPIGNLYLFVDLCQPRCLFSNWFYEESNGLDGLQRADDVADDTCHGMVWPDTYVF